MQESVTKCGDVTPPYAKCYLTGEKFVGKFVTLTTKQDGNENPIMICLADIAVIQAEGILAGNTKIILRGSGKAVQIPMSYCDVTRKIYAAMKTPPENAEGEEPKKKPFVYRGNISYIGNTKSIKVFDERNTNKHFGVFITTDDAYVCIPLKHCLPFDWQPVEGGEVKFINKDDVEW